MPFDGFTTSALVWELEKKLLRARVDQITQPEPLEVVLGLRQPGQNIPLLLSCDPKFARANFASRQLSNPTSPPPFCMVLRKYLQGARLVDIAQKNWERIIYFTFQTATSETLVLALELMGRHSNLILFEPEKREIIDAIKHVTEDVNRFREVVPGARYLDPPQGGRLSPEELTLPTLEKMLSASSGSCKQLLLQSFVGLSPFLTEELLAQCGYGPDVSCAEVEGEKLWQSWQNLLALQRNAQFQPCIVAGGNDFAAFLPLKSPATPVSSLEAAVAQTLDRSAWEEKLSKAKGSLRRAVRRAIKKTQRKIAAQKAELFTAEDAEHYRIKGELLKASLGQVPPGSSQVTLPNYYHPELKPITIDLDPSLSPQANVEKLFRRYGKLKKGKQEIARQLALSQQELEYLESVEQSLLDASFEELPEIEAELREAGLLPPLRRAKKVPASSPHRFRFRDHEILVGRNNYQNDRLTLRQAKGSDLWLHAKQIPGSHVIVRPGTDDEEVINVAAQLAAYYSKARESQNVPVDFTLVKHVHKPNGAKPGFVVYKGEKTVFVNPLYHKELEVD
jgi:predicted ribosome quality control (RQC) complex YloA/Tae2 family protein